VINPDEIECGAVPMPNAFTPNHDGRNDEFFISNPFALEVLQAFEIFDRVGNKVFSTTQVSDSWDGTYQGQDLNPGLFLYKIKYTCQGKDQVKSGSVMLIR
jgi:gliding motility-associated-like protein